MLSRPGELVLAIAGIGAIAPGCVGWPATRARIVSGHPEFTASETDGHPRWLGLLPDLPHFKLSFPEIRPPRPVALTQAVLLAAREALFAAGLADAGPSERIGVMIDRTWDAPATGDLLGPVVAAGAARTRPLLFAQSVANAPLGAVARWLGLRGPQVQTMGGGAWTLAALTLADGSADAMLVVGCDGLMPSLVDAYEAAGLAANGPAPAPYQPDSPGPTMAEGAVAMLLRASRAGEPTLDAVAEMTGAGPISMGAGADSGLVEDAVRAVLERAAVSPSAVRGWVGCGGGDRHADAAERAGVTAALGRALAPSPIAGALGEGGGLALAAGLAFATTCAATTLVTRLDVHGRCTAALVSAGAR